MSSDLIDKGYQPRDVEKKWYDFWEKESLFAAEDKSGKKPYSIVIPPPNVTGVLHMGHALNNTLQDVLCRYRRLKDENVLWMPGTDHAGIATQNVVEKKLASEGKSRHDVGREKFIERVWEWKKESGNAIIGQLKSLGASCDWDRERFTMDEGLSKAVRKVFVTLYKEGLIYRGNYITNWCPRCNTALADLEVEFADVPGNLYHIKYPLSDGSGSFVVATTRPETMFGDTALAINPDDERYADIKTDSVSLPLTGRKIPVIKDSYVDMSFGTGALKVTPAHDPNDFEIGLRHKLESIKVISDSGIMLEGAGSFEGLTREECRKQVVEQLEKEGLLVKIEPHDHSVGHCYRCKTIIEPNLSLQWFVKTKPLAEKAIEAVKDGRTKIIPEHWTKTYFEWMNNIRDWCISRQIWWGHRIPVWTCKDCGEEIVEFETPQKCSKCQSQNIEQDSDVLDTWFSSALWPFSTMGWPDETELLKTFYPTSTLITGFDILFFWVARMMMMGIHFMDEVPFKDVYIHALVRDEHGKKMSKSKGNVINPLTVIDKYGTDAFRYTLVAFAAQGRDIKLSLERVEGYRHFINKLWNAARFSFMHIDEKNRGASIEHAGLVDKWILARLKKTIENVEIALDTYKFNEAAADLYKFVWHEFCDWYLEAVKPSLFGKMGDEKQAASAAVLYKVISEMMVLLHPFIPFITEEIWHRIPGTEGSVMNAEFPSSSVKYFDESDEDIEKEMSLVMSIISGVRNIRGEMNIPPSGFLNAEVHAETDKDCETINIHSDTICSLARLDSLKAMKGGPKPAASATAIVENVAVYVPLAGVIDIDKEAARLTKAIVKIQKEIDGISKKLSNQGFIAKAPEAVVEKVHNQKKDAEEKIEKLQQNLARILEAKE